MANMTTTTKTKETFAQRLRRLRKENELTGVALGYLAKTDSNNISNWERGRFEPRLSTALRVANVLGVSLDYLAGYDEEDEEEDDDEEI